jgi:hypothetical protein
MKIPDYRRKMACKCLLRKSLPGHSLLPGKREAAGLQESAYLVGIKSKGTR